MPSQLKGLKADELVPQLQPVCRIIIIDNRVVNAIEDEHLAHVHTVITNQRIEGALGLKGSVAEPDCCVDLGTRRPRLGVFQQFQQQPLL